MISTSFPSLLGQSIKVPVFNGEHLPYINLDNAATTPPFSQIWERLKELVPFYGSVHRGSGYKSIVSTEYYELALQTIIEFAGGTIKNDIIILGTNATDCLNRLSRRLSLKRNDYIIVSENEHTSNVLPWKKQCNVIECKTNESGSIDLNHLESLLKMYKVRLVSVTGASNVTGLVTNIEPIACLAHKYGALICVDASQLVGHRKIIRSTPDSPSYIDFIIFSGHKMYAPFGVGVLVGNRKHFVDGWPDMVGGGTVKWMDENEIIWSDLQNRESGGTPNYFGVIGLAESCKILQGFGFGNIRLHEDSLLRQARESFNSLSRLKFIHSLDSKIAGEDVIPIFSFHIDGIEHGLIGAYLGYEKAIGVRTGLLCQFNLIKKFIYLTSDFSCLKILNNQQEQWIHNFGLTRVSCGMGNSVEDIIKLTQALNYLIEFGPVAKYHSDNNGNYRPVKYDVKLPFD